jgi:hypothetical protein
MHGPMNVKIYQLRVHIAVTSGSEPRYLLDNRALWAPEPVRTRCRSGKVLSYTGIEAGFLCLLNPRHSHYTDYSILDP